MTRKQLGTEVWQAAMDTMDAASGIEPHQDVINYVHRGERWLAGVAYAWGTSPSIDAAHMYAMIAQTLTDAQPFRIYTLFDVTMCLSPDI